MDAILYASFKELILTTLFPQKAVSIVVLAAEKILLLAETSSLSKRETVAIGIPPYFYNNSNIDLTK